MGHSDCLGFSMPLLVLSAQGRGTAVVEVEEVLLDLQHLPSTGNDPAAQGHDMMASGDVLLEARQRRSLSVAIKR